jgi:hypothetical protein
MAEISARQVGNAHLSRIKTVAVTVVTNDSLLTHSVYMTMRTCPD